MTKLKLPRKLKKAKKHFYLTKQWWDMKDDVKFKLLNRRFGVSGALWDIKLHQMDKPYPYTKWIRKYRVHLLKLRGKPTDWFFSGNYEIPT